MKHDWARMYLDPFNALAMGEPDFLLCECGARAKSSEDPIVSATDCPLKPKQTFFEVTP